MAKKKLTKPKEKLKGEQIPMFPAVQFDSLKTLDEAASRWVRFQHTNIPSEHWVTIAMADDLKLNVVGNPTHVKAAIEKINAIKALLMQDGPKIHVNDKGEAFFQHGDIGFSVDAKDLNAVLGVEQMGVSSPSCIDKLMDSQVMALAHANGMEVSPFVRHLVTQPLLRLVQIVWYRDLQNHTSAALDQNYRLKVDEYHQALKRYTQPEAGETRTRKAPRVSGRSLMMSSSYRALKDAKNVAKGRESALYEVVKSFKRGASFSQIVLAAKDKVKTKQDFEAIITRFLKELIEHKAVEEVK